MVKLNDDITNRQDGSNCSYHNNGNNNIRSNGQGGGGYHVSYPNREGPIVSVSQDPHVSPFEVHLTVMQPPNLLLQTNNNNNKHTKQETDETDDFWAGLEQVAQWIHTIPVQTLHLSHIVPPVISHQNTNHHHHLRSNHGSAATTNTFGAATVRIEAILLQNAKHLTTLHWNLRALSSLTTRTLSLHHDVLDWNLLATAVEHHPRLERIHLEYAFNDEYEYDKKKSAGAYV